MSLAAGRLRHRIRFERPVMTQDPDTGESIPSWELVVEVWAAKEPLSVRDLLAAQAVKDTVLGRFVIRYRNDLTADMRVAHNGKIYNPVGFQEDIDSGLEYLTIPYTLGKDVRV